MSDCWITVRGPDRDLELEGWLHEASGDRSWVVLHPHPQYGGDMNNHVVVALCEALAATGQPALRFNFRGAGRSEGAHAGGVGEREDALAALDEARSAGAKSVSLAGYSFGAAIAASVADEARVERLVLVSPPTIGGAIRVPAEIPTLVVTGANDRVSAAEAVRALTGSNVTAVVLPGVDHGWWPGVDDLTRLVVEFAR